MRNKYLLCIPRGGFNDTLCEIEKCWRYAEENQRILLIDTRKSGLHDDFWRYFSTDSIQVQFEADYQLLNGLTSFPLEVQGRLDSYLSVYDQEATNFVEQGTRRKLTFDLAASHAEDVLIHEQCWAGEFLSTACLGRLKLRPEIQTYITSQIELTRLSNYVGIHVRNTDYKTDYKSLIDQVAGHFKGRDVLICSDDFQVFEYAKTVLIESRLVRLSNFADNAGQPLHEKPCNDQYQTNIEMLADLMALANASTYICTTISGTAKYSGFSILAHQLKDKPGLIHELFGQ